VAEQQGRHLCGCGCGQPIPIRPWHFNLGIPAYLAGHNTRVSNPNPNAGRQAPDRQPCNCGCGQVAASGKRYISGHNSRGRQLPPEARQKLSDIHR
jgi:hypothetical protein